MEWTPAAPTRTPIATRKTPADCLRSLCTALPLSSHETSRRLPAERTCGPRAEADGEGVERDVTRARRPERVLPPPHVREAERNPPALMQESERTRAQWFLLMLCKSGCGAGI